LAGSCGINVHGNMVKNSMSISELARTVGIGKTSAYSYRWHGEFTVGGARRVRTEAIEQRMKLGLELTCGKYSRTDQRREGVEC
jgi:hypothetical protein